MPSGERRRHTSTVTVAFVDGLESASSFDEADVDLHTYRGSGPGGQHRNKVETAVRARHRPTGIEARSEAQRSWFRNREAAMAELERRVLEAERVADSAIRNADRVAQIGVGDRPSHDWTWCDWRDTVTHHPSGRSWSMAAALRGRLL